MTFGGERGGSTGPGQEVAGGTQGGHVRGAEEAVAAAAVGGVDVGGLTDVWALFADAGDSVPFRLQTQLVRVVPRQLLSRVWHGHCSIGEQVGGRAGLQG
eukprot:CAMPEP_0201282846 /NCGR_PEP_ID=MMETSP1317-20130820/6862_1 /ASSEMBLY_ACC=CAM_ASM_000770 /TAXON_ID=187299 /ORGANISM="Undescribed Undescribed, Strain Undescribed" /LENGTH=99 /DNA_ID=CAMNT_0047596973 /DNA_START=39 /DNA_END=339 /DNA_ORIENTATION=-